MIQILNNSCILPFLSTERLEQLNQILLNEDGLLKILPYSFYQQNITQEELSVWCNDNALYGIPTQELIDWLKDRIIVDKTIEIGAGNGVLGLALGIQQTDSYVQIDKNDLFKQAYPVPLVLVKYHKGVKKMEAQKAVNKLSPDIVVASWVTQWGHPGIPDSFSFGVDEKRLLTCIKKYIFIGNKRVHGRKLIKQYPHEEYQFEWLLSRSIKRDQNVIWVWNCEDIK